MQLADIGLQLTVVLSELFDEQIFLLYDFGMLILVEYRLYLYLVVV